MLNSLHIENIAVVKSIDVDFNDGFSVLTGETGAGKSIIIDSIGLLLGKKIEKDIIRKGESSAMVSGLFSSLSNAALAAFSDAGVMPDDDGCVLIQRSVSRDGKSQVKINGRSVSLSVLKSVSGMLVNIHGQSDTYALTSPENHLPILDMFVGNGELLEEYTTLYEQYESIQKEIREISNLEQERIRYTEILEYQIKDIDDMKLYEGEEEELVDKKVKIKSSERIMKQSGFAYKALKGSEKGSVSFLLDKTSAALSSLSDVLPEFSEYSERLRDILYQVDDIAEEVYAVIEDADDDPTEKLNIIESRLDKISKIKRKYGLTIKDVLNFREKSFAELEKYKNSEDILNSLTERSEKVYKEALEVADRLHERRVRSAKELERLVCETLEFLDMPKVVFLISLKENAEVGRKKLSKYGFDSVEFLISANKGMDAKPISKIASGGELARIMLALKSVIADKDGVMTIVFDEIDAGVSGKTARKIGIKMQSLAKSTQLFSVTHSAQIASLSDSHYLISKSDKNGVTETAVKLLDDDGRIAELSRILGGINVTESQRAAAVDMLKEREIYKNK
ncbi:MAG: DNA repair protein RecN [Clostridia bacterium]|nr:DNA repair protein RecN [Clostridia bacterium]